MYWVYVLKSKKNASLYIEMTNDFQRRLGEHNNGSSPSTKRYIPWACIYAEGFSSFEDAEAREKNLKYFGKAYGQLKRRIRASLATA